MTADDRTKSSLPHGSSGCFLNFTDESQRTYIYRIITQERLFELFDRRRNVLVSPSKWEDPFENLILNARVKSGQGASGSFGFREDLYGQCWTLGKASDAMWRIYSPNATGIRMRTTIGKLVRSLSVQVGEWAHQQCFIGKVQYLTLGRLRSFGQAFARNSMSAEAIAGTLLVKRQAFEHEKEVRLVYFEKDRIRHPEGLFEYKLDPHQFIDQLMLDPRSPADGYEALKCTIIRRTGFEGEIKRSTLYDPPEQLIVRLKP